MVLENQLEEAGHKPSKEERKVRAARDQLFNRIFDDGSKKEGQSGFADPALMFK